MAQSKADQLLQDAVAAHRRGAIAEARRLYASVLSIDAANVVACGNLAIILAQQGDLAEAERLLRRELELRPNSATSYNNLGALLQQRGRPEEAVAAHRQAIALNPGYAAAHLALGNAWKQLGNVEQALASYRAAIAAKPDYAEAHNNIGVLLQGAGQLDEAVSAYRAAVARSPGYAEALFNLGTALHQQQDLAAAEAAYHEVIAREPAVAVAHDNLGAVLKDQGRLDEALSAFEAAIRLQPDHAQAWYNRGTVLQQQARRAEALEAYGRAVQLRGNHHDALNNAGIVLQQLGRAGEAVELYRRLLQQTPAHADAHNNMGTSLLAVGRIVEARAAFEQALVLRPAFPEALYNLGNARRELSDLAGAIAAYAEALRLRPGYAEAFSQLVYHRAQACDWQHRDEDQERLLGLVRSGVRVPPFHLLATKASSADQLRCAEQWIEPVRSTPRVIFDRRRDGGDGRIRLGYVSGDFHQHATAELMAGLFERHDRARFEVVAFSYGPDDQSPMRRRLEAAFDRFIDVRGLSHQEAAERIRAAEVDILVDLKGYTQGARPEILASRPAPVQVSYLGYPATMGVDFIDYIIVDPFVVPASEQRYFSERLVHLPDSYQVNDEQREIAPDASSRPDVGLPADGLVFCSFNNSYKISPEMFDIWMRLLLAVPGAVLWLLKTNDLVEGHLRLEAMRRGVDAQRLRFAPVVPLPEHLARHRHADLFLDTLPCNAHTTASDALWAGLPVLTCSGETFAGRVAGSLLRAVGMPELVAASLGEYERTAFDLARDPERLTALRHRLQQNRDRCPLFDLARLTGNLETAYLRMWQTWHSGQAPVAFSVGA